MGVLVAVGFRLLTEPRWRVEPGASVGLSSVVTEAPTESPFPDRHIEFACRSEEGDPPTYSMLVPDGATTKRLFLSDRVVVGLFGPTHDSPGWQDWLRTVHPTESSR